PLPHMKPELLVYMPVCPLPLRAAFALKLPFIEGSFPKYRNASQRFMAILADFSPYLESVSLDEAYLDVTGFESIYGSIYEMAVAIKKRIKTELGLYASVGIASYRFGRRHPHRDPSCFPRGGIPEDYCCSAVSSYLVHPVRKRWCASLEPTPSANGLP
ncbi:unnamed protein product, partial [marine sediment metagenome]